MRSASHINVHADCKKKGTKKYPRKFSEINSAQITQIFAQIGTKYPHRFSNTNSARKKYPRRRTETNSAQIAGKQKFYAQIIKINFGEDWWKVKISCLLFAWRVFLTHECPKVLVACKRFVIIILIFKCNVCKYV